ncbi:Uncharacterized protein DBV15_12639 [Temnothorax longispinosus]|uniref:Uncharacterized protein n=1 Tax=Temnothorax longispinosus TaxID=300112 RepID=A0A4S2KXT8_9HYME|nr:Uncharacterized protein DBV15_12639 [Temnothorax longispinosus]
MSKRKLREADIGELNKQMKRLRKKLKKLEREETKAVKKPSAAIVVGEAQGQKDDREIAATRKEADLVKDASEEGPSQSSRSSTSVDALDTDEEVGTDADVEVIKDEAIDTAVSSLSNETRERLCLKAEPARSTDIALHPTLIAEWMNWMRKGLYEGDEEDDKKREEEESKLREEIMKKFPRGGALQAEAPKLNPEVLAYMSVTAKSRDKHFVSSQNALGSAMVAMGKAISLILELEEDEAAYISLYVYKRQAMGKAISLILELEEDEASSALLHFLGNAGKLLAGLHYQQSVTRRAFILPGIEEKYRDLLRKSDITSELFGKDLFKRLKYTKSLGKVVEDLTPHQQSKKYPKTSNWGNRRSLQRKSKGHSQQAQKSGPQRSLRFKDRQRNTYSNKHAPTRSTRVIRSDLRLSLVRR